MHGSRLIDKKLKAIRYCIVNGYDEDAREHLLDLLRGLRLAVKNFESRRRN